MKLPNKVYSYRNPLVLGQLDSHPSQKSHFEHINTSLSKNNVIVVTLILEKGIRKKLRYIGSLSRINLEA